MLVVCKTRFYLFKKQKVKLRESLFMILIDLPLFVPYWTLLGLYFAHFNGKNLHFIKVPLRKELTRKVDLGRKIAMTKFSLKSTFYILCTGFPKKIRVLSRPVKPFYFEYWFCVRYPALRNHNACDLQSFRYKSPVFKLIGTSQL